MCSSFNGFPLTEHDTTASEFCVQIFSSSFDVDTIVAASALVEMVPRNKDPSREQYVAQAKRHNNKKKCFFVRKRNMIIARKKEMRTYIQPTL